MVRRNLKEMQEELKAIYTQEDGNMPDLTQLDRKHVSPVTRALVITVGVLAVIAVVAWGGFFVWTRGWFTSARPLEVVLEGPDKANAEQVAFFTVRYENNGSVPIASLEMNLNLPVGFELLTADPPPNTDNTWQIGSLSSGSDGSVVLSGVFHSEVPSAETLQAFFSYRPGNYTADFEEIATHHVSIEDSVLDTTVTGPEKALAGDEVVYTINVQNTGSRPVTNVRLFGLLPAGFALTSSEPAVSREDLAEWDMAVLEPGAFLAITVRGKYTSSSSGPQAFGIRTAIASSDQTLLTQNTTETSTDVLGGNLAFHLIVNGATTDVDTDLGDSLRVSVDYANSGNETIGDVVLTLKLDGAGKTLPIDWERADLGTAVRSGSTLVWDSGAIPEFASLPPNSSGILDLTLPIVDDINPASVADQFTALLTADVSRVGSVESPRTVETSPILVQINSDLAAMAEARYYTPEGEPIGTGPLPPTVDETTTYRIFWNIDNSLHTLSRIVLSTNLPPDVAWTDNTHTDIGTLTFDQTTRLVTWSVDKIPTDIASAQATFDVAITPGTEDVGAFFKLTNATSVDANDDTTGSHLSHAIDILTTELPSDETAKGKGVVVE